MPPTYIVLWKEMVNKLVFFYKRMCSVRIILTCEHKLYTLQYMMCVGMCARSFDIRVEILDIRWKRLTLK